MVSHRKVSVADQQAPVLQCLPIIYDNACVRTVPFGVQLTSAQKLAGLRVFDELDVFNCSFQIDTNDDALPFNREYNSVVPGVYNLSFTTVDQTGNTARRVTTVLVQPEPAIRPLPLTTFVTSQFMFFHITPEEFTNPGVYFAFRLAVSSALSVVDKARWGTLHSANISHIVALPANRTSDPTLANATVVTFNIVCNCTDLDALLNDIRVIAGTGHLLLEFQYLISAGLSFSNNVTLRSQIVTDATTGAVCL